MKWHDIPTYKGKIEDWDEFEDWQKEEWKDIANKDGYVDGYAIKDGIGVMILGEILDSDSESITPIFWVRVDERTLERI